MAFFHSVACDNEACGREAAVSDAFPAFRDGCPNQGDAALTDARGASGTDWRRVFLALDGRVLEFSADSDACEAAVRALYAGMS